MTRALVIFDSKFGNTENIAIRLAVILEDQGITTSCMRIGDVDVRKLADADILAIGGPTHTFGMSKPMAEFMDRMSTISLHGKVAFAFDTRFKSILSGSAAKRIEAVLKSLGAVIAAPRYSAFVSTQGVLKQDKIDEELVRIALALVNSVGIPRPRM